MIEGIRRVFLSSGKVRPPSCLSSCGFSTDTKVAFFRECLRLLDLLQYELLFNKAPASLAENRDVSSTKVSASGDSRERLTSKADSVCTSLGQGWPVI
jgi:hypothetical protein